MFDTYGPFVWEQHDADGFDDLFAQIHDANKRLANAVGVYLFVARTEDGQQMPVYVGQTYKGFWERLDQHFKANKFAQLLDKSGTLELFLLPRSSPGGRVRWSTAKMRESRGLKSIDWLELQLIDHCLHLNPSLLNISEASFHKSLHVPGFRDKGTTREPAAKALGKILKVK